MEEPALTDAPRDPVWTPDPDRVTATAMDRFRRAAQDRTGRDLPDSAALLAWSVRDLDGFWSAVWDELGVLGERGAVAYEPATMPDARFFPGATLSLAANILGVGRFPADDLAVECTIEAPDGVAVTARLTRAELAARVAAAARVLADRGVRAGDRVGLILPVGADALVATLAALSLGAVVSSAAPEFGVRAVLDRFGQLDPVVLVAAVGYRWGGKTFDRSENLLDIIRGLPSLTSVLLLPGPVDLTSPVDEGLPEVVRFAALAVAGTPRALRVDDWALAVADRSGATLPTTAFPFDHPAYVLFSSGTTGAPKCLVHRAGGVLLKHLVEQRLHADLGPGDRMMFFTTTGWMMWNWAVSALATGATLVLHDGAPNYPDLLALFALARDLGLTHLGTSARLLDTMRTAGLSLGDAGPFDALRMVLVTGSPLSETTGRWLAAELGPDVLPAPISGGTDLVGCFVGCDPTRPYRPGEMQGPVLGMAVDVVDDDGMPLPHDGTQGELICREPFPTVPLGIWGDPDGSRFRSTYFDRWPGVWAHGDLASWTPADGVVIHGRSDATLNAGGVRIGTGELYRALEDVPEVTEALAFGQAWDGDTRVVLLVVLGPGAALDADLLARIRRTIREECSPRHVPSVVVAVSDLPRTLTGKLAEIAVADAVNGRPVRNRDALANPDALDTIAGLDALRS